MNGLRVMPEETLLPPGSTIGILGGGQLGRMLTMAAARLGFNCHIYAPHGDNPAFAIAGTATAADYDDETALAAFAGSVDVATYEFENVPLATAEFVHEKTPLLPLPNALEVSQHRANEKAFFRDIGVRTADWIFDEDVDIVALHAGEDLNRGTSRGIIKTCRMGYDGKGQVRVSSEKELRKAWQEMPGELIFEWEVPFSREISVIGARTSDGSIKCFDIAENTHEFGILRSSSVPAQIRSATASRAREIAARVLAELDYVGVLAIEMFVVETDSGEQLLVNEFAPRVHNSGHWTEAACATSQFEQHIRAIAGWPLGNPARHSDVEMTNLLGNEVDNWNSHAAQSNSVLHIYGKNQSLPGRKMGHVTHLKALSNR